MSSNHSGKRCPRYHHCAPSSFVPIAPVVAPMPCHPLYTTHYEDAIALASLSTLGNSPLFSFPNPLLSLPNPDT